MWRKSKGNLYLGNAECPWYLTYVTVCDKDKILCTCLSESNNSVESLGNS